MSTADGEKRKTLEKWAFRGVCPSSFSTCSNGVGYQIDLLLQTKRSQCVVEIKRRTSIKKSIIDEVAAKIAKMKKSPGMSIRAALVYDGNLAETVPSDGYFDAIIPFRRLLGI